MRLARGVGARILAAANSMLTMIGLVLVLAAQAAPTAASEIWHCTITTDPMGHKGLVVALDRPAGVALPVTPAHLPGSYRLALPRFNADGQAHLPHDGPYAPWDLWCDADGCVSSIRSYTGTFAWKFAISPGGQHFRWTSIRLSQSAPVSATDEYGFCSQHPNVSPSQIKAR